VSNVWHDTIHDTYEEDIYLVQSNTDEERERLITWINDANINYLDDRYILIKHTAPWQVDEVITHLSEYDEWWGIDNEEEGA